MLPQLPDVGGHVGGWTEHHHLPALCSHHQTTDCVILQCKQSSSQQQQCSTHTLSMPHPAGDFPAWKGWHEHVCEAERCCR